MAHCRIFFPRFLQSIRKQYAPRLSCCSAVTFRLLFNMKPALNSGCVWGAFSPLPPRPRRPTDSDFIGFSYLRQRPRPPPNQLVGGVVVKRAAFAALLLPSSFYFSRSQMNRCEIRSGTALRPCPSLRPLAASSNLWRRRISFRNRFNNI